MLVDQAKQLHSSLTLMQSTYDGELPVVSLHFNGHFFRWTWVSRCLFKQRMMEVVSGDNWTTGAISPAKLQSNHHHQQTNIQFLYRPNALSVAQPTVSEH